MSIRERKREKINAEKFFFLLINREQDVVNRLAMQTRNAFLPLDKEYLDRIISCALLFTHNNTLVQKPTFLISNADAFSIETLTCHYINSSLASQLSLCVAYVLENE